jgi:hypothetical protein
MDGPLVTAQRTRQGGCVDLGRQRFQLNPDHLAASSLI